jgi:hypothetical protein
LNGDPTRPYDEKQQANRGKKEAILGRLFSKRSHPVATQWWVNQQVYCNFGFFL